MRTGLDGSISGSSGVTNNANLLYNLAGNQAAGYAIAGSGALIKSGTGTLTLTGMNSYAGTTTVSGGTLQLAGGSLTPSAGEYIGSGGTGTFVQSGGTNAAPSLDLGFNSSGSGSYSLGGGLLRLGGLTQGSGTAAFNFSGGTLQAGGSFSSGVPMQLTGMSTFDTNGNSMSLSGILSGSGALTKAGSGNLTLTGINTFSGTATVSGGSLQLPSGSLAASMEYIGSGGTGTLLQMGGTNVVNTGFATIDIGFNAGDLGVYSLSGGSVAASYVNLGKSGSGSFLQSGGTIAVSSLLSVGSGIGTGSYNLSGGSLGALVRTSEILATAVSPRVAGPTP